MHVLHYVPNFRNPVGGREIFVRGLTYNLQRYGVHQSIITNSNNGKMGTIPFDKDIAVFSLPVRKKIGAYWILKNISSIVEDSKWDIINIHGYGEYAGDIVCILKKLRRLNVPLLLTTHGIVGLKNGYSALNSSLSFTRKERIFRLLHLFYDFTLGKLEMTTFDKIVILSGEEKKYLSKIGLKEKDAINIPIAINEIFMKYQPHCSSEKNYVLYVGRLERYKGIDILVKAIKELQLDNIDLKCIIVGKDYGYKSKLEFLIGQLKISNMIEIKDHVSQEALLNLYSSALVTVLASWSEGFPLTLVESMALGTPFIATPVGAIPELVNISKAGILVPIDSPKNLAQAIGNLLENKALWSQLSANGRNFAINFTWEKITKLYFDLYLEMVR